eukprot:SAG11_NODE_668_length_7841_cov_10.134461_9_plen_82_part_00
MMSVKTYEGALVRPLAILAKPAVLARVELVAELIAIAVLFSSQLSALSSDISALKIVSAPTLYHGVVRPRSSKLIRSWSNG